MKKILILSLLAALAAFSTAQVAGPAGGAPQNTQKGEHAKISKADMERINAEILDKLGLTDDQKAKLKAHREEMAGKLKDLRKGAKGGDKEALKEKVKALRKEDQQFLKQTLTKDQMKEMGRLRREKIKELRDKTTPVKP